jgi:hypothetical protein
LKIIIKIYKKIKIILKYIFIKNKSIKKIKIKEFMV